MPPSRKNVESTARVDWFLPVGVVVVGVFVIVALLLNPTESPQAQTDLQPQQAAQSHSRIELQQNYADPTENTDGAATLTAQAYPDGAPTSTPTDEPEEEEEDADDDQPSSGSGSGSVFDTDTPSPTPSDTGTPTETRTPRPTSDAETPTPTGTEPTVPDAEADILTCIPGEPTFIQGTGPPNTAVVLWFDDLQVGGAATDSTGFYRVPITVGISRADTFLIEVKTRERRLLVGEALCEVNTTPSPVPALQLAPEAPTAPVIPAPVNPPPGVQNTSVPQTVPGAGVDAGTVIDERVSPEWWPCEEDQIKGNRDSLIYHPPDGRFYDRTYENVECFDTTSEAETAGYSSYETVEPGTLFGDDVYPEWWPCEEDQIKGNRNSMIYHSPDGRFYSSTYEDVDCFDTPSEAETAGYRASQR